MKTDRKKPLPDFPDKVTNHKVGKKKKKRFTLIWKFLSGKCYEQKYHTARAATTAKKDWEHRAANCTTWFPPETCTVELIEL